MGVTKSNKNNISSPKGNSLALFVDYNDNNLKLKDIGGVVQDITDYVTGIPSGVLQLQNGVPLDSTYRAVQDQNGNNSPLYMSLNGVTAIGTGGIISNTVLGADSFLYNNNGYENAIFGWYEAMSSYYLTEPVDFVGYGNVYFGSETFSIGNAIRNVFVGNTMFLNADTTTISCTDNILIANGIDSLREVNENNIYIGTNGYNSQSTNTIAIGVGNAVDIAGISNNNIALGVFNILNINANNTISIGNTNLVSNNTIDFSYNDIAIGSYVMYNTYSTESSVTQDNIIIKNNGETIVGNYTPRFAEKSINICTYGDSMFAVQIGREMIARQSRRDLDYIDYTSTVIASTYAETSSSTSSPILNRKLTVVNWDGYVNVSRAIDCTFIGASGGGLTDAGSNPRNTLIGYGNFITKSFFISTTVGYNASDCTVCGNYAGRTNVNSQYAVNNLTILGNAYRNNISSNNNNTLVGALNLASGGLTTKSNCTSIGFNALRLSSGGTGNSTAIGSGALDTESTGANNTAIGASSRSGGTSQTHTVIGQAAVNSVTGTVGVTMIGQGITNSTAGTGSLILGKSAANTAASRVVIGSASVNAGTIAVESLVSNTTWTVIINGTQYKMLLSA